MALIVHKYGGTSLADPERIRRVASHICATRAAGHELVVVVSAMGRTTDELAELAEQLSHAPGARHPRELDMLLTAGERIAMALLAMAVREAGQEAISFTGSQAAIITDSRHTGARIQEVRADRVREELDRGRVVIVAGFQGVSRAREVTTLGRGGSDTTAVALAAALGAERCEIHTDVTGVFTADPAVVPGARRIDHIGYDEMTELAVSGARVLHARAVEIAGRFEVPVRVRPAAAPDEDGTLIARREPSMEDPAITGVASEAGYVRVVLRGLPLAPATMTGLLDGLTAADVSVDLLSQVDDPDGRTIQLTVRTSDLEAARAVYGPLVAEADGPAEEKTGLARVTLVGSAMHKRPGVFAQVFSLLEAGGVEVYDVSASSVSIIVMVAAEEEETAVRLLHDGFELAAT